MERAEIVSEIRRLIERYGEEDVKWAIAWDEASEIEDVSQGDLAGIYFAGVAPYKDFLEEDMVSWIMDPGFTDEEIGCVLSRIEMVCKEVKDNSL